MPTTHLLPPDIQHLYEVHEWRNATAVLKEACNPEWEEILDALRRFKLHRSEILTPGGRRSLIVERLESPLKNSDWLEKKFETSILVDGVEWNNKEPIFDRDLNNFRLLFDLRVIDVGVIITRADHLQTLFDKLDRGKSYGSSTTHMGKLIPRIEGGSGGGCPILVFGITTNVYLED